MRELAADAVVPLVELLAYTVASVALTVGGLLAESAGLHGLTGGDPVSGAWISIIGAVALVGGLLVARREVLPRLPA